MSAKKKQNPYIGRSLEEEIQSYVTKDPAYAELLKQEIARLELARLIRTERERQGLSQVELATRVGTKQSAIARLESGRVMPRLDLLQRIAEAFGKSLHVHFV